jgi:hypothetical protein
MSRQDRPGNSFPPLSSMLYGTHPSKAKNTDPLDGQITDLSIRAIRVLLTPCTLSDAITRPRGYLYWDSRQHNPLEDCRKPNPDSEH